MSASADPVAVQADGDTSDSTYLIYDGECPFCAAYVKFMRLRQSVGPVRLIDAREGGAEVQRARADGFDLDDGMLFHYGGRDYHGADALNIMAMLSSESAWFSKLNGALFKSPRVAAVAYPVLRAGRNTALRLLGRKKIDA